MELLKQECARCGNRRGLHKWDTESCPNSHWRAGNGRPQWLGVEFTTVATPLMEKLKVHLKPVAP